jgi:hypothetical protein
MAVYTTGTETDDLYLVAALLRMGVNLDPKMPFRTLEPAGSKVPKFVFYFQGRSGCRRFETAELIKRWDDTEWMQRHPEHPWSYLWGLARYHQEVMKVVKNAAPLAEVRSGGLTGFLSMNADPAMEAKYFRRIAEMKRSGRRSRMGI